MTTTRDALVEALYQTAGKAEIIDGTVVRMSPTGASPGIAAGNVFASLRSWQRATGEGRAFPDNVGFLVELRHRQSFSPDAAWKRDVVPTMQFVEGAPDFAVEVRSEGDYGPAAERAIAAKRADYFAAGTSVVWDVDLLGDEVIRSYVAADPGQPRVFRRGEIADAEPAVPGWRFPVNELTE